MKSRMNRLLITISSMLLAVSPAFSQGEYSISDDSVGSVKIGMSVGEARAAAKGMTLKRSSDGEGLALVSFIKGKETQFIVYAGEGDPSEAIDEGSKIEYIEVVSGKYSTPEGLKPGMKLSETVSKAGALKQIMMSEIESREYAEFEGLSDKFIVRLQAESGDAGIYTEGSNRTSKAVPDARIYSISIREWPDGGPMDGSASVMELIAKAVEDFSEMRTRTIEIKAESAEDDSKLTVVITDDGYLDDSVRGKRTTLVVERGADGIWNIKSSAEAWRCYEGRGHTDFSTDPCI